MAPTLRGSYVWFSGRDYNATDGAVEIWLLLLVDQLTDCQAYLAGSTMPRIIGFGKTLESCYGVYPTSRRDDDR
jgi:hypothetical protein